MWVMSHTSWLMTFSLGDLSIIDKRAYIDEVILCWDVINTSFALHHYAGYGHWTYFIYIIFVNVRFGISTTAIRNWVYPQRPQLFNHHVAVKHANLPNCFCSLLLHEWSAPNECEIYKLLRSHTNHAITCCLFNQFHTIQQNPSK